MDNEQDGDARLAEVQLSQDDLSTVTERTANGDDSLLQLPPTHPLAAMDFASKGISPGATGSQANNLGGLGGGWRHQFGVK